MARTPKDEKLTVARPRKVQVTQWVEVTLDESKFDEKFMSEFREYFYPFATIEDHYQHLAQMGARGLYDSYSPFIEGYGPPKDMGIKIHVCSNETETEMMP